MPKIPSLINGVTVNIAPAVKNDVTQKVVDALKHCIKPDVAQGETLTAIFVSSARRQSSGTSNHNVGRAVDISRVNGVRMDPGVTTNSTVKAIVRAIQNAFESYAHRRENFGPSVMLKLGATPNLTAEKLKKLADQHKNHIHFSVNP
jgi:hypothetical protein